MFPPSMVADSGVGEHHHNKTHLHKRWCAASHQPQAYMESFPLSSLPPPSPHGPPQKIRNLFQPKQKEIQPAHQKSHLQQVGN